MKQRFQVTFERKDFPVVVTDLRNSEQHHFRSIEEATDFLDWHENEQRRRRRERRSRP
jgi:predicted alpha/beta hydrolase